MHVIYLAGGCFWGVEEYFRFVPGVLETEVGYANSLVPNPSYEQVYTGKTEAVEACKIIYNQNIISLKEILVHLFKIIDPTSINKQGGDVGTQYRTGIYYSNINDKETIQEFIKDEAKSFNSPIAVEVLPIENFYKAEEYHQKYLEKNPGGYCHVPKFMIEALKMKTNI